MTQKYFSVHRVGYIDLNGLEQQKGKLLREAIESAANNITDSHNGEWHVSYENLAEGLDESLESGELDESTAKEVKAFLDKARAIDATGDLIIYRS